MSVDKGFEWFGFKRPSIAVMAVAILLLSPLAQASDKDKAVETALATLEVSAIKEVMQDTVRVVFGAQATGSSAAEVNRKLSETLDQARAGFAMPANVEVASGNFNVFLDYGKDNKPKGWAGRASLVVIGQNLEAVSSVIEHLGKTLALSSVDFSLSRKARREHEKLLMQDLANEFGERAALTAQAFGYTKYELLGLDFTSGADFESRPVMQRMAAAPMLSDSGLALTLEPATTTVEISVTGQIRLRR